MGFVGAEDELVSRETSVFGWAAMAFDILDGRGERFELADPRDSIFALLGLIMPEERQDITCDCNSSLCEVFWNVIRVTAMLLTVDDVEKTLNSLITNVHDKRATQISERRTLHHNTSLKYLLLQFTTNNHGRPFKRS